MKITDAVLILLGRNPMASDEMARLINTEEQFAPLRTRWGRVKQDQVYAAMSGLRSKGRVEGNFIQPLNGRIGKNMVYSLTGYGEKRLRALVAGQDELQLPPVMIEAVDHPPHYGGADNPYEAIKVIEAWDLSFNLGNTVKYIARAPHKGATVQDLEKARWYLDREISKMKGIPLDQR